MSRVRTLLSSAAVGAAALIGSLVLASPVSAQYIGKLQGFDVRAVFPMMIVVTSKKLLGASD